MTIVVPGHYEAGAIQQVLLGKTYRHVWTTPIAVPVLDLGRFAGGLKPQKTGGGQETIGLHLKGADGVEYKFRSVDKHPTKNLPKGVQKSPVGRIIQDEMSQQYPGAATVASALLDAAGVLHARPRMYVMPDDPRLGEFREEFAGMLGTIEPKEPSFPGLRYYAKTENFFDSLKSDPKEQVDARAYLKARLMDIFMGDWDRHIDQWHWAAFSGKPGVVWQPVPMDRDWAFGHWDGPGAYFMRQYVPQTVGFGDQYPSILGLTWTGKELDHRLLPGLERPVWDSIAADLKSRLSDSAIALAVRSQPPEFQRVAGAYLERTLRQRRDHLLDAAGDFYHLVAENADVHGTDASELVLIERGPGMVDVKIRAYVPGGWLETFRRRFLDSETHEVRVYLHGGVDTAVVRGQGSRMLVRVVGHPDDRMIDSSAGHTRFYRDEQDYPVPTTAKKQKKEAKEALELKAAGSRQTTSEQFAPQAQGPNFLSPSEPITWGHRWVTLPYMAYHTEADQGAILGMTVARYGYGFRSDPYRSLVKVTAAYAFDGKGLRVDALAENRALTSRFGGRVDSRFSQIEPFRFYGFGNASPWSDDSKTQLLQDMVRIWPQLFLEDPRVKVALGPTLQLTNPHVAPGTPLSSLAPLGSGRLVLAGVRGAVGLKTGAPLGEGFGAQVNLLSTLGRSVSGAYASFVRGGAHAATYFTPPGVPAAPTIAVRAGYQRVWGTYPFQEAAVLGGEQDLRGYDFGRFAGDAATYVGSELRIRALAVKDVNIGVLGLADAGRVFLRGENSSTMHTSFGGGLWAKAPHIGMVNIVAARSAEDLEVFIYTGSLFVHP
jgi:hypothetical protein